MGRDRIGSFCTGLFTSKSSTVSLHMLHPSCLAFSPLYTSTPSASFTALWCVGIWRMSPSRPRKPHISAGRWWDVTGCDFSLSSLYHLRDRSATWRQCHRTERHCSLWCIRSPGAIAEMEGRGGPPNISNNTVNELCGYINGLGVLICCFNMYFELLLGFIFFSKNRITLARKCTSKCYDTL